MEERQIRTGIDKFLDLVNSSNELKILDASKKLGVPEETLEIWADILLKESLVEIGYDGFGKMVVRKSVAKKQESEAPIKELPGGAPSAASHKLSLRERLSGMKRKSSNPLLKKYSKTKIDGGVQSEGTAFSRFVSMFKKRFAGSGSSSGVARQAPKQTAPSQRIAAREKHGMKKRDVVKRHPGQSKGIAPHKSIPARKNSKIKTVNDLDDLGKKIAALKKKVRS